MNQTPCRAPLAVTLLCCSSVLAQWRPELPPPALPVVPPPVDHPAYLGQPLMPTSTPAIAPADANVAAAGSPVPTAAELAAQAAADTRVAGKALKQHVRRVLDLPWHEDLFDARAASAATGKPILWLQALGDLEGFA